MADLSSLTTDKRLSFQKYVTDNKRYAEIDFEIEKGKSTALFTKKGSNLVESAKEYKEGTLLKITDPNLQVFGSLKMASVKIGNQKGYIPINKIRKPTAGNGTQYEDEVVDAINNYIKQAGGPIDIKLKGDRKVYKNILYAIKVDSELKRKAGVKGDPKADIVLCQDIKNPLTKSSIFISHKKEGGPEAFQQYGGLSEQAGEKIANHKLVQKFLSKVAEMIGDSDKLASPVLGKFEDTQLSNMSIYGPEYGKDFSLQHTQMIAQGKPTFKIERDVCILDFTSHMSLSGDLSHFSGGYTPVFGATFRAGRGFDYDGKRYNGARVAIYPEKLMSTRSGLIKFKI